MIEESKNADAQAKLTPFDYTLSLIGGKWRMKIMYQLASGQVMRYGELKRQLPAITHKMLSFQLKDLESCGIVKREEFPQVPPKVEYSLTPRGRSLMPILEGMCRWGVENQ
ncbi:winged helix-turn-helix transcriptional regulator [Paenibacillus sp. 481]|uniref:winged helix-turn-helix transcriptional regulator n=1 Tax=Paenibacillus sp. 481 TaxID=2835869 RepID=UPI001E4B2BC6|nr:helix-turn-helix domain-containing protein [Paenibacillus sp. 481]UHA72493.1 helix-turn-helix transcriptional regulator [Paenibacillus sp. 481]